jgi:hypothetical protein
MAEAKTQGDKLQRDMAQETNLVAQANTAQAVGHTDAARAIANQIVVVCQLIAGEQPA